MSKRVSFKNESGFKGYWLQFTDNGGVEYRAEHRGGGAYSVYVSNGEAFVHAAIVDVDTLKGFLKTNEINSLSLMTTSQTLLKGE